MILERALIGRHKPQTFKQNDCASVLSFLLACEGLVLKKLKRQSILGFIVVLSTCLSALCQSIIFLLEIILNLFLGSYFWCLIIDCCGIFVVSNNTINNQIKEIEVSSSFHNEVKYA